MVRRLATLLCALVAGFIVSYSPAASACDGKHSKAKAGDEKACSCPHHADEAKATAKDVDDALAGKCTCTGQSDCTCKKGQCECPKCAGKEHTELMERLKGRKDALQLPDTARNDATAGLFI